MIMYNSINISNTCIFRRVKQICNIGRYLYTVLSWPFFFFFLIGSHYLSHTDLKTISSGFSLSSVEIAFMAYMTFSSWVKNTSLIYLLEGDDTI
jgi:hypothetical protein